MRLGCEDKGPVDVLVVGAGAAGGNCVVRLAEGLVRTGAADLAGRLVWVSDSFARGTSRQSGSDKQTYYKLGTSATSAIAAVDFAKTLTGGGACHGDSALVEAVGSLPAFYHLVDLGVPFPRDGYGAFVGYQTDNDPYQSATSAGPLTSKFMSEALEAQATRLGVPRHSGLALIDIEPSPGGGWVGVFLDLDSVKQGRAKLVVFASRYLVVATGGPGMLFKTTAYPPGIVSAHGVLLRRGAAGVSLGEWQFGLASVRPRWNVSGSYLQAIPRVFSTDAEGGAERDFLNDYIPDTGRQASMIFLKGYQWPFDVDHLPDGSSLVDLAAYREQLAGRRIWLDFQRNPAGATGAFSIDSLSAEARDYLQQRGATGERPMDRLRAINPPAIAFYGQRGVDLGREPLEVAVCAQHNNGGIQVDLNWQSDLDGVYVAGELAGTHGVRRPGGSALNAGQVGGYRAACAILEKLRTSGPPEHTLTVPAEHLAERYAARLSGSFDGAEVIERVQSRMDRAAGIMRSEQTVSQTLAELSELYHEVCRDGWRVRDAREVPRAFEAENLLTTAMAYLHNVLSYLQAGGGSRGASMVCRDDGPAIHDRLVDVDNEPWRYLPENKALRERVFVTWCDDVSGSCKTESHPVRPMDYRPVPFERVYLETATESEKAWMDIDEKGTGE